MEAERCKWEKLWRPQGTVRPRPDWGTVDRLPRPAVEQFRRAARSFPRTTGIGVEGILPADLDALDDMGIDACIDVMMACEAVGYIPKAIALVLVKMIPKKDGGRRPIGLLPSLYRVWAKVRRGEVRDWERKWAGPYFAAGPGKAADTAAWVSALRAELAAASNASSATVLWDLLKCFEHGQHFLLAEEAAAVKFPVAIARMSAEMYCAERRLIVDDAVSGAIHPTRGFMAGCARALALIKVVMVRKMDAYVARHPRVNLDLYVDDVELQATGTRRIIDTMTAAVTDLKKVLTEDLGFPLAEEKSRVIASTDSIAEEIVAATDGSAGKMARRAVKLGVELTSGRRIGRTGGHQRNRVRKALARQRRLMKFRKMGGAAVKVARRGVVPAAAYGNKVCGVSDAELGRIRTLIGKTIAPNTKGTSLALKLLLDGDPAVEANAAPITKWAQVAWGAAAQIRRTDEDENAPRVAGAPAAQHSEGARAAGVPGTQRCEVERQSLTREFRIPQLNAAIAYAERDTAGGSWETVSGPAGATVMTARRLGWRFKDGTTILDERGKLVDMAKTAPSCVRSAVERATRGACAAAAAQRWQRPEFRHGIWTKPLRVAMGRLPPPARAALRRTWMGGYWSKARLADSGLANDAECDKCGCKRDDAYHRIWEC